MSAPPAGAISMQESDHAASESGEHNTLRPTEPRSGDVCVPAPAVSAGKAATADPTSATGQSPLPLPLQVLMVVVLSSALGYAIVVTPLALVDHFQKSTVLPAAAMCSAVLALVWLRAIAPLARSRFGVPTTVALSTIAVMTALNMRYSSQNVIQDRDPGAYNDTGQWFAHHNTFFFSGLTGAFALHPRQLFVAGAGFQAGAPGGRIYPQFLHALPAFLAAANWFGGTALMLRANALLGALALLAFFAFARTWLDKRFAAMAVILLAVNLIEVLNSRNSYSEILSQVFLFGGLWALSDADRVGRTSLYVITGLMLGATCMVRIDGFLFLIPLTVIATTRLWHCSALPMNEAVHVRRTVVGAAGGALFTSALGLLDGIRFSRPYLDDNKSFLLAIAAGLVVTIAGCKLALVIHSGRSRPLFSRRFVTTFATVAGIAIVVFFAWAWFIRPDTQIGHQMARPVGGIFDLRFPTLPKQIRIRTYSEQTVPRLNLFLGVSTLAGGILGAAFVTRRVISDSSDPRLPFLLVFGVTTLLYVWQPSIAADMVWFLRRFLPVTIPGLILLSMALAQELWRVRWPVAKVGAAVLIIGGLAFPFVILPRYMTHRTHVPLATGLDQACARLGPDVAIVIVQSHDISTGPQYRYPQALQAFCDVPVATAPPNLPSDFYENLAAEWRQRNRRLVVVANLPQALDATPGDARVLQESSYRILERSLTHRPTHFQLKKLVLFYKPVPARTGT